jgi:DNA-binding LacI/PurR family transcriptional regulator
VRTKLRRNTPEPALPSTRLKYQQVKDYVLEQIADGQLKPGDVLPPETVLAKNLGRGVQTVRHALNELSQERIVRRVRGKGTLVRGREPAAPRQKLDVFALILPEVGVSLYPSLTQGFIEGAGQLHHQVLTCNCNTPTDVHVQGDVILQLLNRKNVGGVAIVPTVTPMPAHQLEVLQAHGIPVVFCHRRPDALAAPLVTWPWEDVGHRAGEALVARGHRRVAFVAAGRYEVSITYLAGLRTVLQRQGVDLPDDRVLYNLDVETPPAESVDRRLASLLQASDRPTAVFCSDTTEGERVFLEAMRLGLRVPEDLSIVGFGCVRREGVLSQRLAAVTIDEVDLGRQAALRLSRMQADGPPFDQAEMILMPLEFSEGQTLAAAS